MNSASWSFLLACLCCGRLCADPVDGNAPVIALESQRIVTTATGVDAPTELRLVQFDGPLGPRVQAALQDAGMRVYTYLPDHAFLVRAPAAQQGRLRALGARWSGAYLPRYKVGSGLRTLARSRTTKAQQLIVQVFPDVSVDGVVAKLRALQVPGILAHGQGRFFSRIRLTLDGEQIAEHVDRIAALDEVFWIDREPRRALLNDTTIWVGQSGLAPSHTTPVFDRGIHGEGQVVAVLDTGIDPDMCFFREPAAGLPTSNACNGGTLVDASRRKIIATDFLWSNDCAGGIGATEWDSQDHGSHVAGTVAGDNLATPVTHDAGDGMAPAARLVIQDGGYAVDNCGDLPGIGCPVVDLGPIFQQAYDQGARIHSNSWGDNENAAVQNNYSAGSQDVDEFMWQHKDFLILFAAGNSGPDVATVSSPSTAKSGVSVGSTQRAASANAMSSFSSCGPTSDGRIKPELTVPGSSIVSADNDANAASNNCGTRTSSGTSMATPGAAGMAALIRQYFVDGFHPTGAAVPANARIPSAALLRAGLVHAGENMSGSTVMPANCQGWGRVQLDSALYFSGDTRRLWLNDDTAGFTEAGSELVYEFAVAAGEPFKATLAWTDYPSTPAASIHLVNDLDLEVEWSGSTYLGNVWGSGHSITGGNADRRNTLEQVLINSPAAGTARVTVRSHNLPFGPQPWALMVSGAITAQAVDLLHEDGFE